MRGIPLSVRRHQKNNKHSLGLSPLSNLLSPLELGVSPPFFFAKEKAEILFFVVLFFTHTRTPAHPHTPSFSPVSQLCTDFFFSPSSTKAKRLGPPPVRLLNSMANSKDQILKRLGITEGVYSQIRVSTVPFPFFRLWLSFLAKDGKRG